MTSQWGRKTTGVRAVAQVASDRVDNRIAIVTGGYAGMGLRCVEALVGRGVSVVVPARDMTKARAALRGLPSVVIRPMDLMDPDSIDAFVGWFTSNYDRFDYLIGCAGIMTPPLRRDGRGHESQFSTNHLGHFHLATRLAELLAASDGHPRLVLVSSRAQRIAGNLTGKSHIDADGTVRGDDPLPDSAVSGINLDDPDWVTTPYEPMLAYAASKTANVLMVVEFDRRWRDRGVRAFAVHPGLIPGTDLGREHHIPALVRRLVGTRAAVATINVLRRVTGQVHGEGDRFKTAAQGAGTVLWAALCEDLDGQGGAYCQDCHVAPVVSDPRTEDGVFTWAVDPDKASRLWQLSESLIPTTG
ncbi:MAG: SDR family NAD(P)-dependent oxidoreductase [Propionibacteriaceae bacterium]|nr:SDR family NAD(P)-dependent oxidoreductase [Propionibacteriaceae bacterium]